MNNIDYKDLVGKIFGYLTIIEVEEKGKGATIKVRCKCGQEKIKSASRVITGHCKSCGCRDFPRLHRTNPLHPIIEPNKKYGKLITISKSTERRECDRTSQTWWICRCDCGKIKNVRETHIKYGNVLTCGCMRDGMKNPRWRGFNEISTRYFRCIKVGAQKRNLSFNITMKQMWNKFIEQDKKCALSGLSLNFPTTSGSLVDGNISLDRIDSSKGYEINNIQWIKKELNTMKMDCSDEEFITYCRIITDYQNKKSQKINFETIDYQI